MHPWIKLGSVLLQVHASLANLFPASRQSKERDDVTRLHSANANGGRSFQLFPLAESVFRRTLRRKETCGAFSRFRQAKFSK
jgi:hypothetical protein